MARMPYDFTLTESERQDQYARPVYAVCSAGAGRWFWLAESHDWFWRGPDGEAGSASDRWPERWPELGSGYAPDRTTALALAREAAGPEATEEWPSYAIQVHKERARARNMAKAANRNQHDTNAHTPEHVYVVEGGPHWDDWLRSDHYRVEAIPIRRKTARYVFIQRWNDPHGAAIRLDRIRLERDGTHPIKGFWATVDGLYHATPPDVSTMNAERSRNRGPSPATVAAFAYLSLDTYAIAEDIERSYRRLALSHHPDRGGNGDQFIILQAAYETAIGFAQLGTGVTA